MYVHMYICLYVYTYVCIYVYVYRYIYVYLYICISVYMYTSKHVYVFLCIYDLGHNHVLVSPGWWWKTTHEISIQMRPPWLRSESYVPYWPEQHFGTVILCDGDPNLLGLHQWGQHEHWTRLHVYIYIYLYIYCSETMEMERQTDPNALIAILRFF